MSLSKAGSINALTYNYFDKFCKPPRDYMHVSRKFHTMFQSC